MNAFLCVSPLCYLPRRHEPACADVDCRGCLHARAVDGSRLCTLCCSRLARDAMQAAALYADLERVLAASGSAGETVGGSRDRGLKINERATEARTEIRHVLVAIAKYIAEERGIALPPDSIPSVGAFIAKHKDWLAADDGADEHAVELHHLARDFWGVAYPSGTRVIDLGQCPAVVNGDERCPGTVKAIIRPRPGPGQPDLPKEIQCDQHREGCENRLCRGCLHRWESPEWKLFERLIRRWKAAA